MNTNHRKIEIIAITTAALALLYLLYALMQPDIDANTTEIVFTIQFTISVTFLTAISFASASYLGMFYAQERFGKDLILAISSLYVGLTAFFHMISHRGSYYSRFFELSAFKSNLFLYMGLAVLILGMLISQRYDARAFTKTGEVGVIVIGLIILPMISIYLLFQPLQVYILILDQTLVANMVSGVIIVLIVLDIIALLGTGTKIPKRKNSIPTGTLLLVGFILISLVLKLLQGAIGADYQPRELIAVASSLFGYLTFAISLLGTSMIDPHWRK